MIEKARSVLTNTGDGHLTVQLHPSSADRRGDSLATTRIAPCGAETVRHKRGCHCFRKRQIFLGYRLDRPRQKGLGLLTSTDQVTVTGHSLGGHLAALALRVFPGLFDQAVTFNAPGNDPNIGMEEGVGLKKLLLNLAVITLSSDPLDKIAAIDDIVARGAKLTDEFLVNMIGEFQPPTISGFDDPGIAGRLHALVSESEAPGDDPSVVSSTLITGEAASVHVPVTTEVNSHSMSQLVDALGVQALLEHLSPNIGLVGAGQLIAAASDRGTNTLEHLTGALYRLLIDGSAADPQESVSRGLLYIVDPPTPFEGRGSLHSQLLSIEQKLAAIAHDDIAYRYALQHLSPFAVLGADQAATEALYASHNTNHALDLFNPTTRTGLSDAWLSGRARMLSQLILANHADSHVAEGGLFHDEFYEDIGQGIQIASDPEIAGTGHPRTRPPGPVPDPILRSSISNISGSACTRHCVSSMPDRIGSPAQRYNNREAIRPCTTACLAIAAATRGMRGTPSPSRRPTPICNHSMD